jgi:hypothetical protein
MASSSGSTLFEASGVDWPFSSMAAVTGSGETAKDEELRDDS